MGKVKGIIEQPASHVLEVERESGQVFLVPFINEFVKEVDLENKKLVIAPIKGMVE